VPVLAPAAPLQQSTPLGPVSRLPHTPGADIWVDSEGMPDARAVPPVAGVQAGVIRRVQILVFRPSGDKLTWDQLTSLYAEEGILPRAAKAEPTSLFSVPRAQGQPLDPNAVAEETNVYRTRVPGELAVMGLSRNLRTQQQFVYVAVLSGKIDNIQAVIYAKSMVNELMVQALARRAGPPVPPGAVPAGQAVRMEGMQLRQLLQAIEQNPGIGPQVKKIGREVLPQATAVTYTSWRTPAPLSDSAFFDFYAREAVKLGWGPPVTKDETQPGRPTMLFQKANGQGVVMVRAQAAPPGPVGQVSRPTTLIYVLDIEGKIDVQNLGPRRQ
jgi:hypothetical protein